MPKIMLMGYGRHGKDTVADILKNTYSLRIANSSWFVAEKAVYPILRDLYGYSSVEDCYNDRHNHRQEWYELIKAYNTPDLAKMSREIFKTNDVYVGIRNIEEYLAAKESKVFGYSIWIDAEKRIGTKEGNESCTVHAGLADITIDNNGPFENLRANVQKAMKYMFID